MSALATLGQALSKQTGMPAQAAAAPGDKQLNSAVSAAPVTPAAPATSASKIVIPPNPLANILGTQSTPTVTTPIGGMSSRNPANIPGSVANVVKNTGNVGNAEAANNPYLQNTLASGAVNYYTNQINQGTADKTKAAQDLSDSQAALQKAQQDITTNNYGSVNEGSGNYDVSSGQAPQIILNYNTSEYYVLQSDGTYKNVGKPTYGYVNGQPTQTNSALADAQKANGKGAIIRVGANQIGQAVTDFTALGKAQAGITAANTLSTQADAQIASGKTALASAQAHLTDTGNAVAQSQNTAQLGAALGNIGGSINSAYSTDVSTAQQAQTAVQQQSGLGTVGNSGASLAASAFGQANIAQTNAQGLNLAHAGLVDQQAENVGSALQSALSNAQGQSGLQLQTMQQDLGSAIQALQTDLQYASGEQQQAIQQYINSLQNAQAQLQNSIGSGTLTQNVITSVGGAAASGVASATAAYTAFAKNSAASGSK